ncbi:tetratricopeptide repeat protein 9C-like [Ornithodoros turicata]|uniref:tetratricopeptide repeat protein 9C-like n=1 Tax=Ornithodoros turicata TaxID=34597 RepID=UPI00313892C2
MDQADSISEVQHDEPQSNEQPKKELSVTEKLERAQEFKEEGNALFKEKKVKAAMGKYHRCLLFVRGAEEHSRPEFMQLVTSADSRQKLPPELQQRSDKLKMDCYNNLAACLLQLEDANARRVISYCDNVLALSPNNAKAMYRKGVAYYNLNDFDTALRTLQQAEKHTRKPDASINNYLELCQKAMKDYAEKEKQCYQKMFV